MTVGGPEVPEVPDSARGAHSTPGARLFTTYRALLAEPGARAFVVAGVIGRFPLSMLGLGAVLLVSGLTGSYGTAGAVSATLAVSSAVVAPVAGSLSDRRGQRPVLLVALTLHVLGVAGLVVAVVAGAPTWTYFPPAALAGAATPQVGAFVRARWTALVGGTARLHTAFSLESALDEVVFVIGPVLATFLSSKAWPPAAVLTAAALAGTGSLLLAGQRRTEPAPMPAERGARSGSALRAPGLRVVALVFVAVGATFGTIEVSMVAFAQEHGSTAAAGPLLAVLAFGSLVSGLRYGTVRWRRPMRDRFVTALAAFTALGAVPLALAPNIGLMAVAAAVAGLTIAPTLVAGIGLVEALVPASARTEGFAWVGTALNAGFAPGAYLAGWVIDSSGAHHALLTGVGTGCVALVVAVAGFGHLRTDVARAH